MLYYCWWILQLIIIPFATSELRNIPIKTHKYEYDGYGNNVENPKWGTALGTRVRFVPDEDGFFERPGVPRSEHNGLPSARRIMEELFLFPQLKQKKASTSTNDLKLVFGMLLSTDLLHGAGANESEPFDIPIDGNITTTDGVFCPVTGQFHAIQSNVMPFPRYTHELIPGKKNNNNNNNSISEPIRATINAHTAFLDHGCIYGITEKENDEIRDPNDRRLLDMVDNDNGKGLMPRRPYIRFCFGITPTGYSMQILWMRLHNHVAKIISEENPGLDEEQVFQAARNYVIATYQKVALTKYVPSLIGDSMGPFPGYDPTVDPSIDEYFAAISYRYGHSEQPNVFRLVDEDFLPTSEDPIFLRDGFFMDPQSIVERTGGIENFLRGATVQPTRPFDYSFVTDMNFYGMAASMVDVQRARDVGIPPYNQARRNLGLEPMGSIREIVEAGGYENEELVRVMENLYGNDTEKVDSFVATLFEKPNDPDGVFGPSLTMSTRDQINRIRTGDRFWYENVFTEQEIAELPSMTDVVKLVCTGMDKFPETFFRVYGYDNDGSSTNDGGESCEGRQNQVGLLGGDLSVMWTIQQKSELDNVEKSTIELTLTASAQMEGAGFLGIGWRSRKMAGAELWFCTIDPALFGQVQMTESCEERHEASPSMFSCCLASGANVKPQCLRTDDPRFYQLDVVSWCLSQEESSVTINVVICDDSVETDDGCFDISSNPDGTIDMIASYNPNGQNKPHGFQRRTSTVVDLKAGILTAAEAGVASSGLIAYHGLTMLAFWLCGAPLGIFIVRYMKTKSWRVGMHISILGAVGGLTIPIVIGIESAVGASSDKTQEHSLVGIILTFLIFPMFVTGRVRYSKLQGSSVSRRTSYWCFRFHQFYGYAILIFAWWNCYTGLVRISPADSHFQIVVLSSFPFGYDLPMFGVIKNHIFWPYLCVVFCIFVLAEIRKRLLDQRLHAKQLKAVSKTIWGDENDSEKRYEEMDRGKFLELVKLGTPLCVIDGRVLDLTGFIEHHPGGSDMLEGVAGTDISAEVKGLRAVGGFSHKHSYLAVKKMKKLTIAEFVSDGNEESGGQSAEDMMERPSGASPVDMEHTGVALRRKPEARLFQRARIACLAFVTPSHEITAENKPVIVLYLAAPKRPDSESRDGIVPSSAYRFRITNPWGSTFEAYYTPVRLRGPSALKKGELGDDEEILEFLISIRPGGQLEKACMSWTAGEMLPIFGPTVSPKVRQQISSTAPTHTVLLFAAGTGIAPMLQLIDFYSPKRMKGSPNIFLIWLLKNPQNNYNEWIGLEEYVKVFRGKFRWTVLYSSSTKPGETLSSRRQMQKQRTYRRFTTRNLGDMRSKDPHAFHKRFKDGSTLDESSRRTVPAEQSMESESESNNEPVVMNNEFWRVHGNKCISLKLSQEVVSKLLSATEAFLSQEVVNVDDESFIEHLNNEEPHTRKNNMVGYICGNPGFDDCIRTWLLDSDFPKEKITDFYSSPTVHI